MAKMSKDEIKWWIEDHKGKFYAICGSIVGVILVVIIMIASQFKSEPVIEAPSEDTYEELDIGGFDVNQQIQKEEDAENVKQEAEFGVKFEIASRKIDEYNLLDILINGNSSPYYLYVEDNTFESGVLDSSTESLMNSSYCKDIFYLRCKLEDLSEEEKASWKERDRRKVLDIFRDATINKETSKEWDNHLVEVKVSKGFTEKDTIETIGEEKWNEIMNEMYTYFETYLLGLENEETGSTSPLKEYLRTNPYPDYDRIKIAKSPVYLCDVKTRGWSVFTVDNLEKYADIYWDAYYSDAKEIFFNQGDIVDYTELTAGKYYKLKKSVDFVLNCSNTETDIVFWCRDFYGNTQTTYIPKISSVWENQEDGGYYNSKNITIDTDIEFFGYFVVGESYNRVLTGKIPFESKNENGELVLEQKDFDISENIKYTREKMLGENTTINVSEFLMSDGPYDVPFGKYYIKNDSEENVTLYTDNESSQISLSPGSEIYLDSSIHNFTWRVER